MANDYKRMWTREEVKSNSVVDLPDIPDVVDANSPDIIRVQGKMYYKKEVTKDEVTNLTGTKWKFNELLNLNADYYFYCKINFKSNNKNYIVIANENPDLTWRDSNDNQVFVYEDVTYSIGWLDQTYRTIEIIDGQDVKNEYLLDFLKENATLLQGYIYTELGTDEDLVKSIPTDVSIIEDQGKLELMLEHDGNVLAINDTPNQFLQRRLDKPSAVWDASTSETDLASWLQEQLPSMYEGQLISFRDSSGDYNGILLIHHKSNTTLETKPLGIYPSTYTFITSVDIIMNEEGIFVSQYEHDSTITISFNDIEYIKLY